MRLVELALFSDDVPAMTKWWQVFLGVDPKVKAPGIAIFDRGSYEVLIHERYEPGPEDLPCEDHVAFAVTDLEGAFDRLVDQGLTPEAAPRTYEWGRSAYLRDPDGRLIELQLAPPTPDATL